MSDEYTPSIERVRDLYSFAYAWRSRDRLDQDEADLSGVREQQRAEFDRFIAARDREVERVTAEKCAGIAEASWATLPVEVVMRRNIASLIRAAFRLAPDEKGGA